MKATHSLSAVGLICALTFSSVCSACSLVPCINHGIELRNSFVIRVTHEEKPLLGVSVQITKQDETKETEIFSAVTAMNGEVRVQNLPPGHYWLNAQLLGISADYECFHVNARSTRNAKRNLKFEWGDDAPSVRQDSGKFVDSQPGHGESAFLNQIHRVDVPISGARLTLRNPLTGTVYTTVTHTDGGFSFGDIPDGVYVLHVGGKNAIRGTSYQPADVLFRLSRVGSPLEMLWLEHTYPVLGGCGGISLVVVRNRAKQ